MLPLVSVIIPVYNGEKYIAEALESVFAQTLQNFEIIVINDGSTDRTEQQLEKYRDRIHYVQQENRGLAATRGRGVGLARGSLIAFLDADDVWLPEKLERQVEAAREHPDCGIVTTDALAFSGERVVLRSMKEKENRPKSGDVLEDLLFGNWIPPSAAMVRRECFEKVQTFDVPPPGYGEDWLMWMQIAAYRPVHFIDQVLVRWRLHSNNMGHHGGDTQFRCLLRNFEIIRERVPHLNGRPNLIDRAAFQVCFRRGFDDLRNLATDQARDKLRLALHYNVRSARTWLLFGIAQLPSAVLRRLRTATRAGRRLLGNQAVAGRTDSSTNCLER
jgi:glycosyltransferase involved in cell wall biosynthesis